MRATLRIVLVMPLLLLGGCPPELHAFVRNDSGEAVVVVVFDEEQPIAAGETRRLTAVPGAGPTDWTVRRGSRTFRYAKAFAPPDGHQGSYFLFWRSVRLALDAEGRFWLLPRHADDGTEPLSPQPPGFPVVPSSGAAAS